MKKAFMATATVVLLAAILVASPFRVGAEAGVCIDLGCPGGETKCADGSFQTRDGYLVVFTCYTQVAPE